MAFNYQGTLDQLLKYDVGRTAYFDVTITKPSGVTGTIFSDPNTVNLSHLCHAAELPGETIATVSQKIYGVVEKFPIMASYNDSTLSFYIPGTGEEEVRLAFLSWITLFTGRSSVLGPIETTYNVKYKDEITSNIIITHYTSAGEKMLQCTLMEAFPIAISQVPLNWSAQNEAMSINVTFAYTEYEYRFFDNSQNSQTFPQTINNAFNLPAPGTQSINTFLTQNIKSIPQTPGIQNSNLLNPNFQSLNQG